MTEAFLHYTWKFKLFDLKDLKTVTGEKLQVINEGTHNHNEGPDFSDARIKVGETLWAGNVEIHLKTSDWKKHHHDTHPAYSNIILHVVYENDSKEIDQRFPVLELKNLMPEKAWEKYQNLMSNRDWIPCEQHILKVDSFKINNWLEGLSIERIADKTQNISSLLKSNNYNWEETFYHFIAHSFGSKVNGNTFQLLTASLPLSILSKHKNNLFQLEALLYGQAGFLEDNLADNYPDELKKEYQHLRKKYKLTPIDAHLWKFLRMRPAVFPTIRISQFAALIHKSSHLFSKILEADTIKELDQYFTATASGYWDDHYTFKTITDKKLPKGLGKNARELILINTVIPFIFLYGSERGSDLHKEKALNFLRELKAEKNVITSNWNRLNIGLNNALDTQASLQLKNNYCNVKRCLSCAIGNSILRYKS